MLAHPAAPPKPAPAAPSRPARLLLFLVVWLLRRLKRTRGEVVGLDHASRQTRHLSDAGAL